MKAKEQERQRIRDEHTLSICPICGAAVFLLKKELHAEWHDTLKGGEG